LKGIEQLERHGDAVVFDGKDAADNARSYIQHTLRKSRSTAIRAIDRAYSGWYDGRTFRVTHSSYVTRVPEGWHMRYSRFTITPKI
jgi:hypothetical protein